jgi:hypothetical protein
MKRLVLFGLAVTAAAVPMASATTSGGQAPTKTLVQAVRVATQDFRDVDQAMAAGYASSNACVSGPQEGAMGVHFVNGPLIENPAVEADQPEILVYEPRNGKLRLLGVEYLVLADAWNQAHPDAPGAPAVLGQHFQFVNSPNRYGLPAFYELHVWAWKDNPLGMFADYNANVSCEQYTGDTGAAAHDHGGS